MKRSTVETVETGSGQPAPTDISRRRLLKGSAAAGSVLMSVHSAPVMAQTVSCTTASNHTSANLSRDNTTWVCQGWAPSKYDSAGKNSWPAAAKALDDNTEFATLFPGTPDAAYGKFKLADVFKLEDNSSLNIVAKHVLAAYLNAISFPSSNGAALPADIVRAIWTGFRVSGSYSPTAGITWYYNSSNPANRGSIIEYLKSTMPVT